VIILEMINRRYEKTVLSLLIRLLFLFLFLEKYKIIITLF
jgi:hypothetical protein